LIYCFVILLTLRVGKNNKYFMHPPPFWNRLFSDAGTSLLQGFSRHDINAPPLMCSGGPEKIVESSHGMHHPVKATEF
jgi:hypothetical protein